MTVCTLRLILKGPYVSVPSGTALAGKLMPVWTMMSASNGDCIYDRIGVPCVNFDCCTGITGRQ